MLAVACCVQAEVLHVSPDGLSLTQALASCADGDVIELADGVYAEPSEAFPLVVDRTVTLCAAPGASPVIAAPKYVAALRVEANGVTLSGMDIHICRTGIYAVGDDMTIERCTIMLADPAWRTSSCGIWAGGVQRAAHDAAGLCVHRVQRFPRGTAALRTQQGSARAHRPV